MSRSHKCGTTKKIAQAEAAQLRRQGKSVKVVRQGFCSGYVAIVQRRKK